MKSIAFAVVVALAAYYAWRHGYLDPAKIGALTSSAPSSGGKSPAEDLEKSLNRGLPRMMNNEISVDRASANNVLIVFHYRFVDLDQFAAAQRYGSSAAELQASLVRDLCGSKEVRDLVLARGREVQLQLRARDGHTVLSAQLRPGGC